VHIIAYDKGVWNVVANGPFVPKMTNAAGVEVLKPENEWTSEEEKKVAYDWKARNILISALGMEEYYRVSHCTTAKAMLDALEVAHEGTTDVKQSRINALTQEFELFRMKDGETIADMQKRFTYLINRLHGLGSPVSNQEANNLNTLDLTALFGKLEEHQQELILLGGHEKRVKKKKGTTKDKEKSIALKTTSKKSNGEEQSNGGESDNDPDDEDMELFVRRYKK
ncbi:zinc knuckle family protein, partial [Trifolium medium]|nr:zinc knuckle family protein [Trifolium medium]